MSKRRRVVLQEPGGQLRRRGRGVGPVLVYTSKHAPVATSNRRTGRDPAPTTQSAQASASRQSPPEPPPLPHARPGRPGRNRVVIADGSPPLRFDAVLFVTPACFSFPTPLHAVPRSATHAMADNTTLRKHQIEVALAMENQAISSGQLKEDNPLDLSDEFRVFCEACRRGDLKVCQEMISTGGVNINSRDKFDYTPLILVSLDLCYSALLAGPPSQHAMVTVNFQG